MKFLKIFFSCLILSFCLYSCKDDIIQQDIPPAIVNPNLPTVQFFQAIGTTDGAIQLTWSPVVNALQYIIYRSENDSLFSKIDSTDQPDNYLDQLNLVSGQIYYYKIQYSTLDNQLSDFSATVSGSLREAYEYSFSFGDFLFGYAVTFDTQGNLYVTDRTAGEIKVYNANHDFVKDILVSPNPSFQRILRGITWSINGNLLVVHSSGGEIIEVTTNDSIVGVYPVSSSSILREIEVDHLGNMYVSDVDNKEIVKLSSNGAFLKKWQMQQTNTNSSFYPSGIEIINNELFTTGVNGNSLIETFDFEGNLKDSVSFPYSAAVIDQDINQNLYMACFNQKVIKVNTNGNVISEIGGTTLRRAVSVSIHPTNGDVYIADEDQPDKIHVFTKK